MLGNPIDYLYDFEQIRIKFCICYEFFIKAFIFGFILRCKLNTVQSTIFAFCQ